MKRVLITGMSGTGKSTLVRGLAARGCRAIDVDEPGWSEAAPDGEWVWRADGVRELLATEDAEVILVAGCASNQVQFYRQFEIIVLSAPANVIRERLATRTTTPFGERPDELAQVHSDLEHTEPKLRGVAGHETDTTAPLDEIVAAVLRIAHSTA
ncbi:MAG: AAA family ATPase [Dehalococcoidia bacterium]